MISPVVLYEPAVAAVTQWRYAPYPEQPDGRLLGEVVTMRFVLE